MKILRFCSFFLLPIALNACKKTENVDTEKPTIDLNIPDAFPLNCDTLYFGETCSFKMLFSDNLELGSFSIDIHHNFDHHSHSTEVTECSLDPSKKPANPFTFIDDFPIPEGQKEYATDMQIAIPSGNNNGLFDDGDYHFFVSLTDKEGWSAQKGLSIKIIHR